MHIHVGLKEVLYRLIENTPHSNENLTVEQRYDAIMLALMGDYYHIQEIPVPPHNISMGEVGEIVGKIGKGQSKRSLIFEQIDKDSINATAEMKKGRFEALKKYIYRNGKWFIFIKDSNIKTISYNEDWEKSIKIRMMQILEEADWF